MNLVISLVFLPPVKTSAIHPLPYPRNERRQHRKYAYYNGLGVAESVEKISNYPRSRLQKSRKPFSEYMLEYYGY